MSKKTKSGIRNFFVPPGGSPRWAYVFPYLVIAVLAIALLAGGTYGWQYTNSPGFCGTTCHTMPPQNAAYLRSPHANVYCSECHIGRASLGEQLSRKTEDVRELYSMVFHTYTFPIRATRSRPARETCEQCHNPEKFSDDSLRVITHFGNDDQNTPTYTYLILHTGGGSQREGLGRGIHWHIENPVYYYTNDANRQDIPYVRVTNPDGSYTEYTDITSGFDPASIQDSQLIEMDCLTCHNRVTHRFNTPQESVDRALSQGLIDVQIPQIRRQAVRVLLASTGSIDEGLQSIASLSDFYRTNLPEVYNQHQAGIEQAVSVLQDIYTQTVFPDQEVNWETYPNNIGHIDTAGCFRCHNGTHLDSNQQAIRLECNLCHSIPNVASTQDFVTRIEISRGPEPESHLNPNWISLHNQVFDPTCSNCHATSDPGGTSNTSFCSNSACHGNIFTFAGFDAPALRQTLISQLPTAVPTPALVPVSGVPDFAANIEPIFTAYCTVCHNNTSPTAGLNLTTFAGVMAGGQDGPVILPGNADGSLLIQVQLGQHFANLSPEELDVVQRWIQAGAPGQ